MLEEPIREVHQHHIFRVFAAFKDDNFVLFFRCDARHIARLVQLSVSLVREQIGKLFWANPRPVRSQHRWHP